MEQLQYTVLRKCTGVVVGARKECVWKVAAVDSVEMYARASAGRFLARTMCNPSRAEVTVYVDPAFVGKGYLSLVGPCWHGTVTTVDLGISVSGLKSDREEANSRLGEG